MTSPWSMDASEISASLYVIVRHKAMALLLLFILRFGPPEVLFGRFVIVRVLLGVPPIGGVYQIRRPRRSLRS